MAKGKSGGGRILSLLNWMLWLGFFLVLVIVYAPLNSYLLKPLLVPEEVRQSDVIVVMGGGVDRGRYLTPLSAQRLIRGVQLYHEGKSKKILFSGGDPGQTGVAEATVMAQEARRLNVPAADIILEKKSNGTYKKVGEIKKIAESRNWKSVLLVTSLSQMKRSLLAFERAGFKVYPAPADPYEKYLGNSLGRLALCKNLLREYGAMIYYKIKGWI